MRDLPDSIREFSRDSWNAWDIPNSFESFMENMRESWDVRGSLSHLWGSFLEKRAGITRVHTRLRSFLGNMQRSPGIAGMWNLSNSFRELSEEYGRSPRTRENREMCGYILMCGKNRKNKIHRSISCPNEMKLLPRHKYEMWKLPEKFHINQNSYSIFRNYRWSEKFIRWTEFFEHVRGFSDLCAVSRTVWTQFLGHVRIFLGMIRISPTIRGFSDCRGELEGRSRRNFSYERSSSNMCGVSRTCAEFLGPVRT